MPVLDTNYLIRAGRGDRVALEARKHFRGEPLIVPAQVAIEYLTGTDDPTRELHAMRRSFRIAHSDDELVLEAATLRARSRGARPRWADIQIAAVAALEGTYVVTTNKRHFTALGVPAWNYEKETTPPRREAQPRNG